MSTPHSPPRLPPTRVLSSYPSTFLAGSRVSCAGATSWLPATCEFPSTLLTRRGSTVPVSRPIAYALPVPIHCAASGVPFGVLRQAEHVSPIRFTSASKMVLRTHPHWWRKVRDSNPRIVVTIAALAVRCFQPDSANLPVLPLYLQRAFTSSSSSGASPVRL